MAGLLALFFLIGFTVGPMGFFPWPVPGTGVALLAPVELPTKAVYLSSRSHRSCSIKLERFVAMPGSYLRPFCSRFNHRLVQPLIKEGRVQHKQIAQFRNLE